MSDTSPQPAIAVFAPHPLLTVTIEPEGPDRQQIHFHAGGQGVWAARMAAHMGARPVLCGFSGGESGELLRTPLSKTVEPGTLRLVRTAASSGCYITDRRSGHRKLVAMTLSDPPSRHELDDLISLTCAEALACGWLIVTNPIPGSALPLEVYGDLVADAKANGCRTLVDLSSPRINSALDGAPDVAKLNDWELAEYVRGPVDTPKRLLRAAQRIQHAGALNVVVTRGHRRALVLGADGPYWLVPPHFEHGFREGCGDSMMGALTAAWASGSTLEQALVVGAAAGAASFLRHGLGNASRYAVDRLVPSVRVESWCEKRETQPGASVPGAITTGC